jgi:hypothetical protein
MGGDTGVQHNFLCFPFDCRVFEYHNVPLKSAFCMLSAVLASLAWSQLLGPPLTCFSLLSNIFYVNSHGILGMELHLVRLMLNVLH